MSLEAEIKSGGLVRGSCRPPPLNSYGPGNLVVMGMVSFLAKSDLPIIVSSV